MNTIVVNIIGCGEISSLFRGRRDAQEWATSVGGQRQRSNHPQAAGQRSRCTLRIHPRFWCDQGSGSERGRDHEL